MAQLTVRTQQSPASAPLEVVERKGVGHPDTLADALAERMSVAYSRHCLAAFGAVLHHNLDKLYLRGGHARTELGVFEMTEPTVLVIGGRVSTTFAGQPIDHHGLFDQVARDYLATVLPNFDHMNWLRVEHVTTDRSRYPTWFHPHALTDLPELSAPTASDTVAVTAWWPHTPTERLVLALEAHFNRHATGPRHRHLGQDIKVMACRRGHIVDVTLNVAVHPLTARTCDDYEHALQQLHDELDEVAAATLPADIKCRILLNTTEANPYAGKRHYLLGSGSCLEFGEEGFVGRGNGPSGLISVYRAKSVEAAFGKNPTYHAGKVYTLYADQIARAVHAACGVGSTVTIVTRNSAPLRDPALIDIAVEGDADPREVAAHATRTLATTDHVALAVEQGHLIPR